MRRKSGAERGKQKDSADKKQGGDATEIMARMKELVAEIKEGSTKVSELEENRMSCC